MTKAEANEVMAVLHVAYPAFYRGATAGDAKAAVSLWAEMFCDDSEKDVMGAVKVLIATRTGGYPPTIGEVKEKLAQMKGGGDELTAEKAWAITAKAAAGDIDWKDLPEKARRVVGSPEVLRDWGLIDIETFNTVIYSQFIKAYRIYEKRDRERIMLPTKLQNMIDGTAASMSLAEGERGGC